MSTSKTGKFLTIAAALASTALAAQQAAPVQEQQTLFSNGVFDVMLAMIVLLLFVIIGMAEVVKAGAALQVKKQKDNKDKAKIVSVVAFLLLAGTMYGQQSAPAAAPAAAPLPFDYWGMGGINFYIMLSVILIEILIIYMLYRTGMHLLDRDERRAKARAARPSAMPAFVEKLNASVSVEEEHAIMLDHNYDGIQELDNNLPPWWKYGFYVTIIFAVIYLFHFHVMHTGKSSLEEYQAQLKEGEEQKAEYRKTAANLVDETNVTLLTDETSIAAGKAIFMTNCKACHGDNGEGKIGPNFTDDYWLHGGNIQSIFKSIKYGWTDKGMREWGSELKPVEMQQVASYIKSLRGTNPPNAKEKQGELYIEDGAKPLADSAPAADSTKSAPAADSAKK